MEILRLPLLLSLVVGFALAGCIEDGATDVADGLVAAAPVALPSLASATGCREGGPVSMYDQATSPGYMPEPWTVEDINDDTGPPPVNSYGRPNTGGATTGIWHFAMLCDSAVVNGETVSPFFMGYVGVKIQAPPWDTSGIERQYFIADLSFSDQWLLDQVMTIGAHTNLATEAQITWLNEERDLIYTQLYDEGHGEFEMYAFLRSHDFPLDSGPMRFWALVPIEKDGKTLYRPVSVDFETTVSDDLAYWVSNQGQRSLVHWDEATGAPDHYGYGGGAVVIENFERSVRLGPQPEGILLEQTWTH